MHIKLLHDVVKQSLTYTSLDMPVYGEQEIFVSCVYTQNACELWCSFMM